MTLDEFHAKLKAEGKWDEYVARQRERDEIYRRREEEYRRIEAPLVSELRAAGSTVNSVWDYVNRKGPPEAAALPVLLEHVQKPYPDNIKDGIARALAGAPGVRSEWPMLLRLYNEEKGFSSRQGFAVLLANIADESVLDELLSVLRDPAQDDNRILLLDALRRIPGEKSKKALMEFGADPLLGHEARRLLKVIARRKRK